MSEDENPQHKGMRNAKVVVSVMLDDSHRQWPTRTWDREEMLAHRIIEELSDRGVDFTTFYTN